MGESETSGPAGRAPSAPEGRIDTAKIERLVKADKVVLFMKGTRTAPQCGFSATVVGLLDQYLPEYTTHNVLVDAEIREGVKRYANWPTIPQLYVDGEFVGGCDIIRQLDEDGELVKTLGDAVRRPEAPSIVITPAAAEVFAQALEEAGEGEVLRLSVDGNFRHDLALDSPQPSDLRVESAGIVLLIDPGSARKLDGVTIDYATAPESGFRIDNPHAPPRVQPISPAEAKAMIERDPGARFLDVRTPEERARAMIEGTTLLDREAFDALMELPKNTPLVFHCHHGMRSHQAAIHFLEQGFTKVYNVSGGIDGWSQEVDPSIPRY